MRTRRWLPTMAVLLLGAATALAGEYGKCTASTQECLDAMAKQLKSRGWVGLEMDAAKGLESMVVTRVVRGSPAEAAGFKPGDRLVALNDVEFCSSNEEALRELQGGMRPGKQVTYRVERDGGVRELAVTLAALPDDVLAQWIGRHMLEHARVDVASK